MRELPPCLQRRNKALDELIKELNTATSCPNSNVECSDENDDEPGLKLMCQFWDILKQDPDCNLQHHVGERLGSNLQCMACITSSKYSNQNDGKDKKKEALNKIRSLCNQASEEDKRSCCSHHDAKHKSPDTNEVLPLSKVLCNLKDAASFDKKCNTSIIELMGTQKELQSQIQQLETREKAGVNLLKEADCMWIEMEAAYKKKIAESMERQAKLSRELQQVESSTKKWRKSKKDLDFQMTSINKTHEEITEKINQKTSDGKYMDMEIKNFEKRIASNNKNIKDANDSLATKKQASDLRMANIATEMRKLKSLLSEEKKHKNDKEQEGNKYIKEARDDLRKLCRVLLQKKLEIEDLRAEKDAILLEIDLLKCTADECKDKCKLKQQSIDEEIKMLDQSLVEFKSQCIRCHQCTDTIDIRKLCSDCPRCLVERDCLYEDEHCCVDSTMDCVCMSVKQKFLDNVFDNMYTVLERQVMTNPGKAVGDAVLMCLQKSRNGKLNKDTRKILQDFILTTVKKNLNITIVGGAVKTRCEMDSDTYKELMLCLKDVQSTRTPKVDQGTNAKKAPCRRWGGTSECNCPKSGKDCICTKKAPPPPNDPTPCPTLPEDKEDEETGAVLACPHKASTSCGPDCAMHAVPSSVGKALAAWRPDPCHEKTCFTKNMRAAQCVLGPESLLKKPKTNKISPPKNHHIHDTRILKDLITGDYDSPPTKTGTTRKGAKPMKTKIIHKCDNGTCTMLWDHVVNDMQKKTIEIQGFENKDIEVKTIPKYFDEKIVSKPQNKATTRINLQKKMTNGENTTYYNANTQTISKQDKVIDQIKLVLDNERIEIKEFTNTSSGTLVIELDGKIFEAIDKKSAKGPNLPASLNKSEPNKYIHQSIEIKKDTIKKSPSGSKLLEIHKNLFFEKNKIGEKFSFHLDIPNRDEKIPDDFPGKEYPEICCCSETVFDINKCVLSKKDFKKPKEVYKDSKELSKICSCSEIALDVNKYILFKKDFKNVDKEGKESPDVCFCSETALDINKYVLLKKDFKKRKESDNDGKEISKICSSSKVAVDINNYVFSKKDLNNVYIDGEESPQVCCCSETGLDINKFVIFKKDFKKPKELDKADKEISKICSCSEIALDVNKYILFKKDFKNVDKEGKESPDVCFCSETALDINKYVLLKKDFKKRKQSDNDGKEISKICSSSEIALDVNKYILFKKDFKNVDKEGKESPDVCFCSETALDINKYVLLKKDFKKPKELDKADKEISKICSCSEIALDINNYILLKKDPTIVDIKSKESTQVCCCNETTLDVSKYVLFKKDFKKTHNVHIGNKEKSQIGCCNFNKDNSSPFIKNKNCILLELKKTYDQYDKKINLKLHGDNGTSKEVPVSVTKTLSGNIAIDLNNMLSLVEFNFKSKEQPVVLTHSDSGTYTLDVTRDCTKKTNASVRRTSYGGYLAVLIDPVPNTETSENNTQMHIPKEELFKVNIKGLDTKEIPSVVLKSTISQNYIMILDKEFENRYTQALKNCDALNIGYIDLVKTNSGNYIIDFEESEKKATYQSKAVLVRSPSGHIKILVNGPELEALRKTSPKVNTEHCRPKVFGELLNKLTPCGKEFHRESPKSSRNVVLKSSSASNLNEKVRTNLQDSINLITKPSAVLKKTDSGQYAVVLNKESKNTFINNLKSYLSTHSHGNTPTKRSESREITIVLNEENDVLGRRGSLKITSSGNIYLIVNEKFIKNMGNINETIVTEKKNTTTCNANSELDDCLCDASKNVCHEMQHQTRWQFEKNKRNPFICKSCGSSQCAGNCCSKTVIDTVKPIKSVATSCVANPDNYHCNDSKQRQNYYGSDRPKKDEHKSVKISVPQYTDKEFCNHDQCTEICSMKNTKPGEKSPHIVIKPCTCPRDLRKKTKSNEQCYYFTEYVCPYHKDRYDDVSNELLEISGLCNKAQQRRYTSKVDFAHKHKDYSSVSSWDSLNYLPPQLPPFLQNVSYR